MASGLFGLSDCSLPNHEPAEGTALSACCVANPSLSCRNRRLTESSIDALVHLIVLNGLLRPYGQKIHPSLKSPAFSQPLAPSDSTKNKICPVNSAAVNVKPDQPTTSPIL